MDEQAIADALAVKLDAEKPEEPRVIEEPQGDPDALREAHFDPILVKQELMDFFDVPGWARSDAQLDTKINAIIDWAKEESGSLDRANLLRVINDQITAMGTRYKEERIAKLYLFVKIRQQHKLLDQKERALYG